MGDDDRTMANLAKTTRTGASSAITRLALTVDNFEINGQFLHMILNQCQFSGTLGEDVNDHIDTFLGICELFKIKDADGDAIKLHVFPFTLTGTTKEWLKSNAHGSITTWHQMKERLLARFFPPALSKKMLSEMTNFVQMPGETLYEAWERLKKYLRQCPQHGLSKHKIVHTFYKGIDKPTRNTIDNSTGGTIMHKTPNEAYKLIKDITVHTHEWYAPQDRVSRRATAKAIEADGVSEIAALTNQMDMFNKKFDKLNATVITMQVGYESCGGPHLTRDCDDKPMSSSKDAC
ncbi:retrotransposon gag protein [Tanacetum coccineum]